KQTGARIFRQSPRGRLSSGTAKRCVVTGGSLETTLAQQVGALDALRVAFSSGLGAGCSQQRVQERTVASPERDRSQHCSRLARSIPSRYQGKPLARCSRIQCRREPWCTHWTAAAQCPAETRDISFARV